MWALSHIIDYINEGVLTGRFTEGERIPSVRDMAELMQVAPQYRRSRL